MAKYGMKLSQKSIEDQHEIKISYNDNSVFYVTFTEQQSSTKETISTSSHIDTTSGSVRDVLTMEDCDRKIFIDLEKKMVRINCFNGYPQRKIRRFLLTITIILRFPV